MRRWRRNRSTTPDSRPRRSTPSQRAARGSAGTVDRSTGRATAISIALHAVVLAGVLLARWQLPDGATSGTGTVINGELVSDLGALFAPTSVPAADDDAGAPPAAPPLPRDDSPPSSREPAANATLAEIASAPASAPEAQDKSTPDPSPASA